jgi:hypothetical protein
MQFTWIKKGENIDDVGQKIQTLLKGNYKKTSSSINPKTTIFEVLSDKLPKIKGNMFLLEKMGYIKIDKASITIDDQYDIVPATEKVMMTNSSPISMQIYFNDFTVILTENEILTSLAFKKKMFQKKKFLYISKNMWPKIMQMWFDMAEVVEEQSEDDMIRESVLNYLLQCTISDDLNIGYLLNTLYLPNKDKREDIGVVWCRTSNIYDLVNKDRKIIIDPRKMRFIFSKYIRGNSFQERVSGGKQSFWRILIDKTEIDIDKQFLNVDEIRKETIGHDPLDIKPVTESKKHDDKPLPKKKDEKDEVKDVGKDVFEA